MVAIALEDLMTVISGQEILAYEDKTIFTVSILEGTAGGTSKGKAFKISSCVPSGVAPNILILEHLDHYEDYFGFDLNTYGVTWTLNDD